VIAAAFKFGAIGFSLRSQLGVSHGGVMGCVELRLLGD